MSVIPWLQTLGFRAIVAMVGFVGAMAVIAISVQAAQAGGIVTTKALAPNFQRINPMTNIGRIAGKQAWVELAKSVLKMADRQLGRVRARSATRGPTSRGSPCSRRSR